MNDFDPPEDDADAKAVNDLLAKLRQEHRDLDGAIDALQAVPVPNQLMIARLKRKKLVLKDEISKLEGRMLPDIIA